MNKKSFLFVESPLQLLNAYEAIDAFNLKKYEIIVRLSNKKENDRQLKYLIKYLDIKNVKFLLIKVEQKSLIDYIKLFIARYKYLGQKIDKIYIGNFNSGFFQVIMKQFKKEQIILLDDGAKTLAIQNQFSKNWFYSFFTMYNIEPIKNQIIYQNKFYKLSNNLGNLKICDNKILFLGMKLSEVGVVQEKEYIRLIKDISNFYKNKKIVYVTHREESSTKLKKIQKISNLTIQSYPFPIELLGIFENSLPYKVVSFYSTAILTMKYIYKIEAECFLFNYKESKHKENIDKVYNYYKEVIEVKELV